MTKKLCTGTSYRIDGKRKMKFKKGTRGKSRKSRKSRKNRKGGNGVTNCCMCGKNVDIKNTLIPRVCLEKNGQRAHRICLECWWDPVTGFAREDAPHGCPGCIKNLPLTVIEPREPMKPIFVDLSEED